MNREIREEEIETDIEDIIIRKGMIDHGKEEGKKDTKKMKNYKDKSIVKVN
jgi:hypothetical protein